MFEASPFPAEETVTIVESRPPAEIVQACVRAILIQSDSNDRKAKPNLAKIDTLLASIRDPEGVRLIGIDYRSRLAALPDVARFRHLEYVYIAGHVVRGYEYLCGLPRIRRLFLVSYPKDNLAPFRASDLEYVRLIRGRVARFDVSTTQAFLQSCNGLLEFGQVRIARLILEACQHVDLTTLAHVKGMTSLRIIGRREIPSFGFIETCTSLRHLVVTATPFRNADLTALFHAGSIEKIFLGGSNKVVEEVATHNHRAIVTNGDVCFRGGSRQQDTRAYYAENEDTPRTT